MIFNSSNQLPEVFIDENSACVDPKDHKAYGAGGLSW